MKERVKVCFSAAMIAVSVKLFILIVLSIPLKQARDLVALTCMSCFSELYIIQRHFDMDMF